MVTTTTDRVEKFISDLEVEKTLITSCTQLFTTLTNHLASLQNSLSTKSQSLESKLQTLESTSHRSLHSFSLRENSIPERESAAATRIEELRESALSEFQKPRASLDLSDSLRSFSRKMDASGLLKFIVSKRKESVALRAEISKAVAEAVDPPRLLLDALDEYVANKIEKVGVTDKRWACGILVQAIFPEVVGNKDGGPEFSQSLLERARGIVEKWKGVLDGEVGPAEAVMFLQTVVGFGLQSRFDQDFFRKMVMDFAARRDMAKLASGLGFAEKLPDIIDELVKSGKEIEAIYFSSESGLTERFPPVSLLKSHLRNSKRNATTVLKNGNYSAAATEESSAMELNAAKAIIKCVEDHKLESEFSVDSLKKRAAQLEKSKSERKKSSASATKPQNKRGHGSGSGRGGGLPAFRPAKVAKFSNAYSSFSRRNPAPPAQHSPAARYSGSYNYPGQSVYEGPTTTPYPSTYGVPHSQSPGAIPQQHYAHPVDNIGTAGFRAPGYGGQTSYGAYDYGNAAASAYQPSPYGQ
ncbi:Frigida domain-containing protein [Cephalotus follicularis]|uniref:FRIGIDA-like protein n=1 Tax=Cephalotus follicularis TaxID=3775 RepID=A0A1Q3CGY2_CEPFO|nr:Frigida domain-containing protein [Cephalotus follicularis]